MVLDVTRYIDVGFVGSSGWDLLDSRLFYTVYMLYGVANSDAGLELQIDCKQLSAGAEVRNPSALGLIMFLY